MFKLFKYYKTLALFITLNLVIGGGLFFSLMYSYRNVVQLRNKANAENNQNLSLSDRLTELKNAKQDISAENIKLVNNLLPAVNPTLVVSMQIRSIASKYAITFDNYHIDSNEIGENINELSITFDANGNYYNLIHFVDELRLQAPLLSLEAVEINVRQDLALAEVTLNSYWADYPTTLPSLDEPINSLNEQELELLSRIGDFKFPSLVSENITPQDPAEQRTSPFIFVDTSSELTEQIEQELLDIIEIQEASDEVQ